MKIAALLCALASANLVSGFWNDQVQRPTKSTLSNREAESYLKPNEAKSDHVFSLLKSRKADVSRKSFSKVLSSKGVYSGRFGGTGELDTCYGTMCGTFDASKFVDGAEEKNEVMTGGFGFCQSGCHMPSGTFSCDSCPVGFYQPDRGDAYLVAKGSSAKTVGNDCAYYSTTVKNGASPSSTKYSTSQLGTSQLACKECPSGFSSDPSKPTSCFPAATEAPTPTPTLATCPPVTFAEGLISFDDNGCTENQVLTAGSSCNVQCADGYASVSGVVECDSSGVLVGQIMCDQCPSVPNGQCTACSSSSACTSIECDSGSLEYHDPPMCVAFVE